MNAVSLRHPNVLVRGSWLAVELASHTPEAGSIMYTLLQAAPNTIAMAVQP